MILQTVLKDVAPELTSGILAVVFLSCTLFVITTYFSLTQAVFSVGASVFENGHVHKLFTFPFYHKTFAQLLLNIAVLVLLCGSLEKGVGTVRFLFLFLLLSTSTGLCYAFLDLLQSDTTQSHVQGLVPIALAFVAVTTMHTRMAKGFLFGVSVPTMALPWVFLIIATVLIPHSVLPCNIIAILVGWMYGKGWFSFLDMSEARACVLDKMTPFRLLKSIRGVVYVPASTDERRKTLLPQINPTPGSYPVQAYAPVSSISTTEHTPKMYEGWPNSVNALSSPVPPLAPHGHGSAHSFGPGHGHSPEHSFGHSCSHGHGHSHDGHGHSHDGHGHSHDGHGHSHDGHSHGHDGHGHSHDQL
ncbi:rhomboid domain-containing protein 2 [Centroberyx gerrardi]